MDKNEGLPKEFKSFEEVIDSQLKWFLRFNQRSEEIRVGSDAWFAVLKPDRK